MTDPPGAPRAAVTARELEVRYARGGALAVSGVDLTVSRGSVLLVTGAAGSGKTSLLHGLLGLAPIAGGVDVLDGPPGRPAGLRRTALAPQGRPFDPRLTARETVTLIATLKGASSDEAGGALHAVGLTAADVPTGRLEPEDVRRLSLALVHVGDPDLVMVDDPWEMPETVETVISARERGAAVILTSSEPGTLAELADSTLHLVEGRPG